MTELRVLHRVDGPSDDLAAAGVHHAAAVDLALAGLVLGDVGEPQLVELKASELPLYEVVRARGALDAVHLRKAGKPGDPDVVHEQRDEVDGDVDPLRLGQLGVDSARTVGATRVGMDLADERHEPLTAHLCLRHRPAPIRVVALGGDAEHLITALHGEPCPDEAVDHRVNPFGWRALPPSIAFARRRISTSDSSSRMRLCAFRSSRDSSVVVPGISPRSIRSCFSQL